MSGIQYLTIGFALLMGYQTYLNIRRRDVGLGGGIFWMALWGGLLVVTLVPGAFQRLSSVVKVARLLDLVTIIGLLAVTAATYRGYINIRRLENRMERLVRAQALREFEQEREASAGPHVDPE